MAPRAIVVGAGIFGLSSALALQERGWDVQVFEAGAIPSPLAASHDISKMVRLEYGADAALTQLMADCLPIWHQWNNELIARGEAPIFHQTGLLVFAEQGYGDYENASLAMLERLEAPYQKLNSKELARFGWALPAAAEGFISSRSGFVESARCLDFLIQKLRAGGAQLFENSPLAALIESSGKTTGIRLATGRERFADLTVLALGAWTPGFDPSLKAELKATAHPVFHFLPKNPEKFRPPSFLPFFADISKTGLYGFPATANGIVKVALHRRGQEGDPGASRELEPCSEQLIRGVLGAVHPELAQSPLVSSHRCFYSDSLDSDFWITADPRRPGLYFATGGSGHALKFAPMLGELLARCVHGEDHPLLPRLKWRPASQETRAEDARSSLK